MANFLFVHGGRRKRKFRERKERRRKEKEEQRRKEKENVQPERSENDLEGIRVEEEEEVSDSPQLRFKPPTPAPFLLHFALPMEDGEEVIEDEEARHLHEQERSGCVGAWEEDGTLWRSHEPPPSQGHIAGIPQIRPEGGEKEMLVPSSSLLPPPLPPIIPPSTPIFQSIHHPEDSFVQSQIRQQQEEALAKEEEKEVEEEEENRVVEPLMRLVEAIFSLPTVRPRTHQQGRQGRKKSVKEERGDLKLPSSGEKQSGGEEARVGVNREQTIADAENGGAERKRIPGNSHPHPHPHFPINPDPGQDHIPSPDNCLLSKQLLEQRGGRGSRRGRRKQGGTRSSKLPRTRFQRQW